MTFRVIVSQEVLDAVDAQMLHLLHEGAPLDRFAAWHERLFDLIDSLGDMPRRFPVAEFVSAATGFEVRRANFGDYAVFYRVDEAQRVVEVVAFRHGRQRPWMEAEQG